MSRNPDMAMIIKYKYVGAQKVVLAAAVSVGLLAVLLDYVGFLEIPCLPPPGPLQTRHCEMVHLASGWRALSTSLLCESVARRR